MSKDDLSPEDRQYLIALLAAGDLDGLKAFKQYKNPEPIKFFCRVIDGVNDETVYDHFGIPLKREESQELIKPQASSSNRMYVPLIKSICICYSSIGRMKAALIEKYSP